MAMRLFVYGTLHPERAPVEIAEVARRLRSLGKARVRGALYDLGEYPGVVMGPQDRGVVQGEVFLLPEDDDTLARMDAYEGFDVGDLAGSLFVRREVRARMEDGAELVCWIYLYNQSGPAERGSPGSRGGGGTA
jgi:gamma-glutamylcyclotransferase (GGCT)/AIG2-like uncharacterized protein YtfP